EATAHAKGRALQSVRHDNRRALPALQASAVVEHVLQAFKVSHPALPVRDHALERYEQRHPKARGMIQGAAVVLQNRDGGILAETGGRQVFNGRAASYSDYNRVTQSLRQHGSTMTAIVY